MGIFGVVLLYGFKHGFDWDHIAAITSITGAQESKTSRFISSLFYILGHAVVIIILGSLAILFGVLLPEWVEGIMDPLVGFTLILLGVWMLVSYFHHASHVQVLSRGHYVLLGLRKLRGLLTGKHYIAHDDDLRSASPFIVGSLHGIGAETPTQMLLFITVGNIDGNTFGLLLLITFVIGLVFSHTLISAFSVLGYAHMKRRNAITITSMLLAAGLSIFVGLAILTGYGDILPPLFRG